MPLGKTTGTKPMNSRRTHFKPNRPSSLIVCAILVVSLGIPDTAHSQAKKNPWTIEFIPKKADTVTVIIDGKAWVPTRAVSGPTWDRQRDKRVTWELPTEFANARRLRIVAVAGPWDKDAEIIVRYNGREVKKMSFGKEEDHLVEP
jgi:hypothetical protein